MSGAFTAVAGVLASSGGAFTTLVDAFTRTSTPISSPGSDGVITWSSPTLGSFNPCNTDGSHIVGSVGGKSNMAIVTNTTPNNQKIIATLATVSAFVGICIRIQGTSDYRGYYVQTATATTLNMYRNDSATSDASFVQLGTAITVTAGTGGGGTLATGDTLEFRAVGSTLTVYVNGTLQGTQTDSTYTSGKVGVDIYNTNLVGGVTVSSAP